MGPLYQAIITADGAPGVSPPAPTVWIAGALALSLLALSAWHWLRRPAADHGRAGGSALAHGTQQTADNTYGLLSRALARPLRDQALALFAAAAGAHLLYMLWFPFQRQGPDFWILFKGARDWARGGSLYDLQAIAANHFGHVFKVPPFYGMLFTPFVFQDGERILFFHRVLNTLLVGAIALSWLRMCGLRLASAAGAGVLVLLNFRPIADTLAFGQIDLALLLLLILALWALRDGRNPDAGRGDILAGALVALGTLFKV